MDDRPPFLRSLAAFSKRVYDEYIAGIPLAEATYEPRSVMAPSGYLSQHCLSGCLKGTCMYAQIKSEEFKFDMPRGVDMTAITATAAALADGVPTFYVAESFLRAAAATELPETLRLDDLHWPRESMIFGLPLKFTREYIGRESGYLLCSRVSAKRTLIVPETSPSITITVPFDKMVTCFHSFGKFMEIQVSAYPITTSIKSTGTDFVYTDLTDASPAEIAEDKVATERMFQLAVKLLLILGTRPAYLTTGARLLPEKYKHGKRKHREIWSPNWIGNGYVSRTSPSRVTAGEDGHASPCLHWRRGHITHTAIGRKGGPDFVHTSAIPRRPDGEFDWESTPPGTRERFWSQHKRMWLEPVLVNAPEELEGGKP